MGVFDAISSIVSGVVSPVTNYLTTKNETKAKIQVAKLDQIKATEDHQAAWELVQAENTDGSWKDEYITIVITMPLVITYLAVIYSVLTGDLTAADAAAKAIASVKVLLPNYEDIATYVCLAAIGIKAVGKVFK